MARPRCTRIAGCLGVLLGSAAAKSLSISGVGGGAAVANGDYEMSEDPADEFFGNSCYKHTTAADVWLCVDSKGLWIVQPTDKRGTALGAVCSKGKNIADPWEAGPYRIVPEGTDDWVVDPNIVVQPLDDAQEGLTSAKDDITSWHDFLPKDLDVDKYKLRGTVALMLFGSLGVGMVGMGLAGSLDPHIRSYFFKLLSTSMSFLMSLLTAQAVWNLFFLQILPADAPWGFGLGTVKSGVKILVTFSMFTISYMLLNFFGWKCQFSTARLFVVKTLGAHLAACFGIGAFTIIQKEATFQASEEFQSEIMDKDTAELFTAAGVVVLAWFTFALYRAAATGARTEIFKQPPANPWPNPSNPPASSSATRPASCTFLGAPSPMVLRKAGPDWGEFVNAAEDEAAVVVMGYLLNQTCTYWVVGELPGLKDVYKSGQDDIIDFWYGAIAVFLLLLIAVVLVRSRFGGGGRAGSILNRMLAMCLAWCIYRAVSWSTTDFLKDDMPLAHVAGLFSISILSVSIMIIMDKVLDFALGRNAVPGVRRMMGSLQGSDSVPLSESGMRIVMTCLGLLVALAWEQAISYSVETVTAFTEPLHEKPVVVSSVISIVLALIMIYPWRRTILPTSEMSEKALEETIRHELLQMDLAEGFVPVATA